MFYSLFSLEGYDVLQVIRAVVDIILLSIVFYCAYKLFGDVKSRLLSNFLLIIILIYVVASLFRLEALLWVLKGVLVWLVVGVLVIFQPELRSLVFRKNYAWFLRSRKQFHNTVDFPVVKQAVQFLVKVRRGALFVFPRTIQLDSVVTTRIEVDARLSAEILQTIFSHDTPLHDGAVIIDKNRLMYAGCYLPLEESSNIVSGLGSRHRAAVSLTNNSDAVVLVISEQNGSVSLAHNGELFYDIGVDKACQYVGQLLHGQAIEISWAKDYTKTVIRNTELQE